MKTQILKSESLLLSDSLHQAQTALASGELVAIPTETVYGLAANAFSEQAVLKIFKAKERPEFDPLIVHISKTLLNSPLEQLSRLGIIDPQSISSDENKIYTKIFALWPGPLTVILPRGPKIPNLVTSGLSTVGVRCPKHDLAQALLSALPFPLAAPSANRFGRISPTRAEQVLAELNGRIPLILDGGPCQVGVESTIVKLESNPTRLTVLRPGQVSAKDLQTLLEIPVCHLSDKVSPITSPVIAPGLLESHYAPLKPFFRIDHAFDQEVGRLELESAIKKFQSRGFKSPLILRLKGLPSDLHYISTAVQTLSESSNWDEAAQSLFTVLRDFDSSPHDVMITETLHSNDGLAHAIENRIQRASKTLF